MPEVKIVRRDYSVKPRTLARLAFVDADHIDKRFGSVAAFLAEFGAKRQVVVNGQPKFAVVCAVDKIMAHTCTSVMTQPIATPPFTLPPDFWIDAARDINVALNAQRDGRSNAQRDRRSNAQRDARSTFKPSHGKNCVIPGSTMLVDLVSKPEQTYIYV